MTVTVAAIATESRYLEDDQAGPGQSVRDRQALLVPSSLPFLSIIIAETLGYIMMAPRGWLSKGCHITSCLIRDETETQRDETGPDGLR